MGTRRDKRFAELAERKDRVISQMEIPVKI